MAARRRGRGCDKERREGWKVYTGTEKGRK